MSKMGSGLRCFVATLALLSLAGRLSAAPLALGVACHNDNPFIKIMHAQGVELYSQPKQVNHICRSEFSVYGTCCNENQLIGYATRDKKEIERDHQRLIKEYTKIVSVTKKLIQDLQTAAATPKPSNTETGKYAKIVAQIDAAIALQASPRFKTLESSFGSTTEAKISLFSNQNYACWMKLAAERSASICATCSGRSSHFFKNGKILISKQKCEELANICAAPMAVITRLITGVEALSQIFRQIADAGFKVDSAKKPNSGRANVDASDAFEGVEIFSALLAPRQSNARGIQSAGSSISESELLCYKFVRMREAIMLEDMEKILGKVADFTFKVDADLRTYIRRRLENPLNRPLALQTSSSDSQWGVGGRLLQFGGSPPPLGSDATFVDPTDPSYSSVGVSGNGAVPLTTTFP